MRAIPDCVPDALSMILATAKAVSDENFIHRKVLLKVMAEMADDGDLGANPADLYLQCWETACRALGVKDPYENEKARSDKTALGILRILAEKYSAFAKDPLRNAIKISLAGAMTNFNGLGRSDMEEEIVQHYQAKPARDDTEKLVGAIEKAGSVMLVSNRAGEIVLDKPLVEILAAMGKRVYVSVAAKPVFLMATEKDAENAVFDGDIQVVNPGTAMFGLMPERASSEFRELLAGVELIIVKGSTHFSAMTSRREMFFILRAADGVAEERLGVPAGAGAVAGAV